MNMIQCIDVVDLPPWPSILKPKRTVNRMFRSACNIGLKYFTPFTLSKHCGVRLPMRKSTMTKALRVWCADDAKVMK